MRGALMGLGIVCVLTAGGACAAADDSSDDRTTAAPEVPEVAQACVDVFGYGDPTADIASIEQVPTSWPDPPAGAVLCMTATSGDVRTASYALDADIASVFDHYDAEIAGLTLVDGDESGTGYATLVGDVDGIGVEVRERDAGAFVLAFATGGA